MTGRNIYKQLVRGVDRALGIVGLVRMKRVKHSNRLLREGRVFIDKKIDGVVVETLDLGTNTLSYPFRVAVAKILARKEAQVQAVLGAGSTFPNGKDGFDYTDQSAFPVYLYIGIDNTPSDATDTRLAYYLTETDTPGDPPLRYTLSRTTIQDTKAEYDLLSEPINVSFEFDIPAGTLRSGGAAEATPYMIREWGLSANDGVIPATDHPIVGAPAMVGDPQIDNANGPTQLARKTADVIKIVEMGLTVRWEIRT